MSRQRDWQLKNPDKVKQMQREQAKKPEEFYYSLELVYQWEIKNNLRK